MPHPPENSAATPTQPQLHERVDLVETLGRWRVKAAFLLVVGSVAWMVLRREPPMELLHSSPWVYAALACILAGVVIRVSALGCLRKNEVLATTGIYSLCRHPLYLGSLVMFTGFCVLMQSWVFWILGFAYYAVFYTAAVIREERFLREKFGAALDEYRARTPAILPYGRYQRGTFCVGHAMRRGAIKLLVSVPLLLVAVEAMAQILPRMRP